MSGAAQSLAKSHEMPTAAGWFAPALFILAPVGASFGAWGVLGAIDVLGHSGGAWENLAGFSEPESLTTRSVVLLVFWYAAVVSMSMLAWRLGTRAPSRPQVVALTNSVLFERRYFFVILLAAFIGIGYSFYQIGSPLSIIESLSEQTGNDLYGSLSNTASPVTLRYSTILAAPIGIYLWRKKVIAWPLMVLSVVLLLMNALLAHRLSLLMAGVVYLAIWVKQREKTPQNSTKAANRWIALLTIAVVGFSLLAALNYFRNANYYRDAGVSNPVAMNLYQMGAYLAVPAQVSIGVSEAVMSGAWRVQSDPVSALTAVQPTFLQLDKVSKEDSWKRASEFGYSVKFAPNFFTVSVFADTYALFGVWGWLYTFGLYALAGYVFARIFRYGTVVAGSAGVVAYCFAEMWRIQILSYGIVIYLLALTIGSAAIAGWSVRRTADR
ncbi:hypothetical protein [Mycolicibacterium mengxianglii]|uniref:hypothetical protein n=1 Tax=Mycolicibacterium mengxianglii TaxID=2736649 RepID=UPI001E5CA462|nr:hypothetical protein [Mycolicibacterium mengxianglii]